MVAGGWVEANWKSVEQMKRIESKSKIRIKIRKKGMGH
jgi:hypothetical protein